MYRHKLIGFAILVGLAAATLPLRGQVRPDLSAEQAMALYGDPAWPTERIYPTPQRFALKLLVHVTSVGLVDSVVVIDPNPGLAELEPQTIAAAKAWRFEPGRLDGRAIATWVEVPFNYTVKPVTIR